MESCSSTKTTKNAKKNPNTNSDSQIQNLHISVGDTCIADVSPNSSVISVSLKVFENNIIVI